MVHIKMVRFDVAKVWKALVLSIGTGSPKNKSKLSKLGFGRQGQGFSVMRNGRELRNGETLSCFSHGSQHNYFKVELEFPTCLDDYFNVQTIKGRYSLDPGLKDALTNRCSSVISSIAKESATQRKSLEVRSSVKFDALKSEKLTKNLKSTLTRKPISHELHQLKQEQLESRKKSVIKAVDRQEEQKLADAVEELEIAKHSNNKEDIDAAEKRIKEIEEDTKIAKKAIRDRFKVDAFCRKWVKPLRDGALYAVEDYHDEIWVTINSESHFFQSLYERASQYSEQTSLLDLIIFSIAYSEADQSSSEEMKEFWNDVRRKLSRLTNLFVNMVKFEEELPKVISDEL